MEKIRTTAGSPPLVCCCVITSYSPTGVGWPRGRRDPSRQVRRRPWRASRASHSWDGRSPCLSAYLRSLFLSPSRPSCGSWSFFPFPLEGEACCSPSISSTSIPVGSSWSRMCTCGSVSSAATCPIDNRFGCALTGDTSCAIFNH